MAECEVVSPVTRKGSKVGSGQPLSAPARDLALHVGRSAKDSIPPQPSHGGASRHSRRTLP